jgi:hypothetical protein
MVSELGDAGLVLQAGEKGPEKSGHCLKLLSRMRLISHDE